MNSLLESVGISSCFDTSNTIEFGIFVIDFARLSSSPNVLMMSFFV